MLELRNATIQKGKQIHELIDIFFNLIYKFILYF
jgi:hypothetical protein